MRRTRTILLSLLTVFLLLLLPMAAQAKTACVPTKVAPKPTHVLIIVIDQMRPEYVNLFNMTNVRWLQQHGATFPNAYVGDVAAETVVSHNVMVSGQLPKHQGWSDEAYRDANNLLNGGAGAMWVTGDLTFAQFSTLVTAANYPKLADYLHAKYPGTKFACVGEKVYPVETAGAPNADIVVSLNKKYVDTFGVQWRGPGAGPLVPTYLNASNPNSQATVEANRFFVNTDTATNNYGTLTTAPAWMYPEEGNRYVPGNDPAHLGGDTWAADAAMTIMQNENWSGMLLTLGGVDKIGHMWGGGLVDNTITSGPDAMVHMPFIAKNADEQVGRVIQKLRDLGELDSTLIVLTADHGQQTATNFYGVNAAKAGDTNWYYGSSVNDGDIYLTASPALSPLLATGNVVFTYQSTAIETWLTDQSAAKKHEAALAMRTLPGVIATYIRDGDHYNLDTATKTSTKMTLAEFIWWRQHGQELVNAMAFDGAADVVGLLADNTGYGVYGDHGGAQKGGQKIPMVIFGPGVKHEVNPAGFRLVDIMPTVLKTMGIPLTHAVDGRAYTLAPAIAVHH